METNCLHIFFVSMATVIVFAQIFQVSNLKFGNLFDCFLRSDTFTVTATGNKRAEGRPGRPKKRKFHGAATCKATEAVFDRVSPAEYLSDSPPQRTGDNLPIIQSARHPAR